MKVILIKNDKLKCLKLPNNILGNFWITDYDSNGREKNLICIEAQNGEWKLISNDEYSVINNEDVVSNITLNSNNFYIIKANAFNQKYLLYVEDVVDSSLKLYNIQELKEINIGKNASNTIIYNINFADDMAFKIVKENDKMLLIDNSKMGIYVNNMRINKNYYLKSNDIIFYLGLKITILKINGMGYLMINNPKNLINTKLKIYPKAVDDSNVLDDENEVEISLYSEEDYFHKKPRFIQKIEKLELTIDNPPAKVDVGDTSILLTLGPMLTMSMTSLVMGYTAINNVINNGYSWSNAMPSLVMCIAMFSSIFIWPLIMRKYEKSKKQKQEKKDKKNIMNILKARKKL